MTKGMLLTAALSVSIFATTATAATETATAKLPKKAKATTTTQTASRNVAQADSTVGGTSSAKAAVEARSLNAAMSEYAHQSKEGESQVVVAPIVMSGTYSLKTKDATKATDYNENGNLLGLAYSHGFSNNVGLVVSANVGDVKTTTKGQQDQMNSGLSDVAVTVQQLVPEERSQKFWGVTGVISPGDHEIGYEFDRAGKHESGTGDRYSGGHAIMPFIGIQNTKGGDVVYGGKGSLRLEMTKRQTTKGSTGDVDIEVSGGNALAAEGFVETQRKGFLMGLKGGIAFISSKDYALTKTKTNFSQDAAQVVRLGAYGQVRVSPKVEILPEVSFSNLMSSTGGDLSLESQNNFIVNVNARIAL